MKCRSKPVCFVVIAFLLFIVIYLFYGYQMNDAIPSNSSAVLSARMKVIYVQQSGGRRNAMREILENKEMSPARFYNVLVPEVFCSELVRIGTINDGGKWMCSPEAMPQNCTVLSLGLNNAVSWEVDLQELTKQRCRLIGYDAAKQSNGTKMKLAAYNAVAKVGFIGKKDVANKSISLETVMKENDIKHIEIFKVDIEGSEFEVLVPFLTKHRVSQVLIEIHPRGPKNQPAGYKFVELLSQLNQLGYLIANYEINGAWHQLSEFTLIHHSALQWYNAYPLAEYMNIL